MTTLLPTTHRALEALRRLGYSHPTIAQPESTPHVVENDVSVGLLHLRDSPPTGLQIWCSAPGQKQSVQITGLKNGVPSQLMHSMLLQLADVPADAHVEPPPPSTPVATTDHHGKWPPETLTEIKALAARDDILCITPGPIFRPRSDGVDLKDVCLGRGYVIRNLRLADGTVCQAHLIPDGISIDQLARRLGMKPPDHLLPLRPVVTTPALGDWAPRFDVQPPPAVPPAPAECHDTQPLAIVRPTKRRMTRRVHRQDQVQRTYAWFRARTRRSLVAWIPTSRLNSAAARRLIAMALVIPTIVCDDQTMVVVLRGPLR